MSNVEKKKYLEDIKNSLTINQIYNFLVDAGGEPEIRDDVIVSRTICHNPPGHGSFKLYYYDNTKLFKCYTQCPENSFDIFQLTLKIKKIANEKIYDRDWELPDAIYYVSSFFGFEEKIKNFLNERTELQDWKIFDKLEAKRSKKKDKNQIISLNFYKDDFLKNLPTPIILPWIKEGITQEILNIHQICYDPLNQGIVIPHYDINNNLIGIRERTLIKENEEKGKYLPAKINGIMYNHPLSFNLYNLNISKNNIKNIKKAIIFEGEKSTLLYSSYFGLDNDISVAACGSNLINYQVDLLLSLGVEEIIIGFDRQYKEVNDEEWKRWTEKLQHINNKYQSFVQISFLWDDPKNNLLDYKDSPVDKGKDVFLHLFENRIKLT